MCRAKRRKLKHSLFRDVSIRKKLIFSYVLVVLLPVLLVGSTLTKSMRQLALDWALHEATVNVDRVKKRITDVMRISIVISNKFFIDRSLEAILERDYPSTLDVVKAYWDYRTLDEYPNLYNEISMIKVYSTNQTLLENWRIMKVTPEILQLPWYQTALKDKGKINWAYISFPEIERSYFSLIRSITGIKPVGVLTISLNPDFLHEILKQESFATLLMDDQGYIVAASERELVDKTAEMVMSGEIIGEDKVQEIYYRGTLCKVISGRISPEENYGSLWIVSIFPVAQIVDKANRASRLGLTIIGTSLVLSFLLIILFSRVLSERIQILSSGTHRVASGDLNYSLVIEGDDEIGQLSKDLNLMVRSIQDLLTEVYEINLQKKELEIEQRDIKLKMLANQINPHFLFNVLETIRMKAHSNGQEEIAQIVKMLGKILRCNLEMNNELVPLVTELELVLCYLQIQKFRFGDKLEYHLEVAADTEEYPVLPLTIQPLVENAVVHGLEKKEGKGLVTINIFFSDQQLHILVKDDGVGMERKKLESLVAELDNGVQRKDRGKHIGVKNTYQRLHLFYGEDFHFRIESRLHQGTEVEILLPWER